MFDLQTLVLFVGAVGVLALIPGPDNLFASAQSLSYGRKAGLAAVTGIITGGLLWTLAATLGLTALIATFPLVFVFLQLAGAGYLLFLAFGMWRAKRTDRSEATNGHAFGKGLATNLLNPKVGLYYLAFLPQFMDADRGPLWAQMLVLGLIFNVIGAIVMSLIACIAGSAHGVLSKNPDQGRFLSRIGALILLTIALKLLWGLALA